MESLTNTLCLLSLQHTQCVCGHGGCVGKSSCVLEILGRARVVYKWRKCLLEGMHGGLWAAGRNYACRQHLLLGEGLSLEQNNCILEELSPMHHFCRLDASLQPVTCRLMSYGGNQTFHYIRNKSMVNERL